MSSWPLAAVAQFCATKAVARNTQICRELVSRAARTGAKMVFLPEASDFIAESGPEAVLLTDSLEDSSFLRGLCDAAKSEKIWVSVGVHEKGSETHIFNTHVVIDDRGCIVSKYQKTHLFNVDIKDGPRLMESDTTYGGNDIGQPVSTPLGQIGLQICYDLRFPELSIAQRYRGAQLLTFPSAFTIKTGMAHWETLLRARAIETQTYVIAAAQVGQHNAKRASFGNAMIVDPWGTVLARCANDVSPSIALAPINLEYLNKVRREMPVMTHRRNDLYPALH